MRPCSTPSGRELCRIICKGGLVILISTTSRSWHHLEDFSFLSEFPFVTCDFQEYGWLWFTLLGAGRRVRSDCACKRAAVFIEASLGLLHQCDSSSWLPVLSGLVHQPQSRSFVVLLPLASARMPISDRGQARRERVSLTRRRQALFGTHCCGLHL